MPTMNISRRALPWLVLVLPACPRDDEPEAPSQPTSTTTSTPVDASTTSAEPPGLDSTGIVADPCDDDYDGNHALASAHPLGLDTTDTARATLGDHVLSGLPAEQGQDRLAVCANRPDFFSIDAACPGYLAVDLRRIGDGALDLHLYADGVELDHTEGTWHGFFLEPVHRSIDAGTVTIEVRHLGVEAPEYSLQVHVLPTAPCS